MEALMLSRVWIMRALSPSTEHRFTAALPSGNPAPWIGAYIMGLPSAPGQPLITQAFCIVIQQHHTLSARPGIWCTGAWTAVGWLSAEQAKMVVGKDGGEGVWNTQTYYLVLISHSLVLSWDFGSGNIKYERQWLEITVSYAQTERNKSGLLDYFSH